MKKLFIAFVAILLCLNPIADARMWGEANISMRTGPQREEAGFPKGLIFLGIYDAGLNADFSEGSGTATFAASRDATHPATYFDSSGVMQKTTSANVGRFNYGYYNTTGYHAFTHAGFIPEGASTNYVTYSIFSSDGGGGLATGWIIGEDDTNEETTTLVDVSSTFNVGTTVQSQRIQMTFSDGSYLILYQDTAAASFAQNDNVAISCWIKGTTSGITVKLGFEEEDNLGAAGTSHLGSDIASSISSTEWRRFTYSTPAVDADCDHVNARPIQIAGIGAADTLDLQIACVNVEKLPFASSFIPTTTAALTRNEETLKYAIAGNRSPSVESCVVKFATEYAKASTNGFPSLTDTDTKVRVVFLHTTGLFFKPNNTDEGAVDATATTDWGLNTERTFGYSCTYNNNPLTTIEVYLDGVSEDTSTTNFTANAWGDYFWVGCANDTTNQLYGTIFSIAFFDRVLSANEMKFMHDTDWRTLNPEGRYYGD